MTSSINNNSNYVPDSLTSWGGEDINADSIGALMEAAALSGIQDGTSGDDNSTDNLTLGSPTDPNSDDYNIGVSYTSSSDSIYNPTSNSDFYNIGVGVSSARSSFLRYNQGIQS